MVKHHLLLNKLFVLLIILILLSLISFNGFDFYQSITTQPESVQEVPAKSIKPPVKKLPSSDTIARWHLMGEQTPKVVKAPKTTLRLK
ncbi:MAG: hypothetical protein KZQ64_01780 [gamma proteobacterium symbiont of Bathyaustriella thionipta]|nr:hypothetical protein [gamma proteobacterium symbiont of Bathyaustriella thionipta]MCU7949883.1 hypothetical protein [gamma proteobacterium symbiont of Bathyaustriella thionipta]MCU7952125.1 hypothetical protein [gamma proteobacterium symbiont of Bathyaustriella thionipta]MCU7956455.1 hypothetical protein [gamma proteobacterium symbiont of Bathyaustriella thionipta]MCU7968767.1 hypothetical protein [gamma proteobacterium symbiont of Bathyaustriella thionipta]